MAKKTVGKVNTIEFVDRVAEHSDSGLSKKVIGNVVREVLDEICSILCDHDAVAFTNLFSLTPKWREERRGRNPQKPEEEIVIPAQWAVTLKVGSGLKVSINEEKKSKAKK